MGKSALKTVCFLLIGVLIWIPIERVFTPDHADQGNPNLTFTSFETLPKDSVDVLFLGSSVVLDGISPMKIYEDTGIRSYNLATSGQPITLSYEVLQRALNNQSPHVVMLDVNSLYRVEDLVGWRYVIDNLPLDLNKVEIAAAYQSLFSQKGENAVNVLLPLLKYHTRWSELNSADFDPKADGFYFTMGQLVYGNVSENTATYKDIDRSSAEEYIVNAIRKIPHIKETQIAVLDKIQDLCERRGIELILFKLPSLVEPHDQYGRLCWSRFTHAEVQNLADSRDLSFIDMIYDVDPGVDFLTDSLDAGVHLNLRGSEKVSAVLGQYLAEHFNMDRKPHPFWENALQSYQCIRQAAFFQSTFDFNTYLQELSEHMEGKTVVLSLRDETVSTLSDEECSMLESLGLYAIREKKLKASYIAVIENGIVKYEDTAAQRLTYDGLIDDHTLKVVSSSANTGSLASVIIDGVEYAVNSRGLNIVVWDNDFGGAIDSLVVDISIPERRIIHSGSISSFVRAYEKYLMQQDREGRTAN